METITSYGTKMQQKQNKMFNILQSAVILLMVICKLDSFLLQDGSNYFLKFLEEKHYRILFKGLCTIPDWKSDSENWAGFTSVEELFFKSAEMKKDIVHILTSMYRKVSSFKELPEVLFSIPVFHFAKGLWEPFKDATHILTFGLEIRASFNHFKELITKW